MISRFSQLLPETGRRQPKAAHLHSKERPMDSGKQRKDHIENSVKGSAEHMFPKTMKSEVEENLVIENRPQTNRAGASVRGSTRSLTQMEEFMKSLNGSKVSAPKTQKSKPPKASSERMSKNRKKQSTKEGRLGKALRKQVVGKALFTVEEWLRRG